MHILLCAATDFEIAPTISLLRKSNLQEKVKVLVTGAGLTAATHAITKALLQHKPALVIQAGVAGSLDNRLVPGDVVLIQNECIGDEGVEEGGNFKSLFDLKLKALNEPPWTNGKLVNARIYEIAGSDCKVADAVTVNEISTSETRIAWYRDHYKAQVESMEGAALHYVCLVENIRFLQVRAISNVIGERDKSKWKMDAAILHLNEKVQQIIRNFQAL